MTYGVVGGELAFDGAASAAAAGVAAGAAAAAAAAALAADAFAPRAVFLPRSLSFAIGHASGCAAEAARWGCRA